MKIYLDSADREEIGEFAHRVDGITTNPTLMRKAGVDNYAGWAMELCAAFPNLPISFEVVTDDQNEMIRQAKLISGWGDNVYVKIPVMTTSGDFTGRVIRKLSKDGVKVNVTAILTRDQVRNVIKALDKSSKAILSIFAGRIADTMVDPQPTVRFAVKHTRMYRGFDVLWASTRQVLDIWRAENYGCDIITVTRPLIDKIALKDRNLTDYSRETVEMFYKDATLSGYTL